MSFPESPLQLRTNLLPPPPPGETAYSDCEQHFLVRAVQNGAEAQKRIRRPYPKYAVRTLETRRADQVIEFDRFWRIDAELGVGSFGAVYRVHVFSTGHSYAIKILRKHDFGTMRNVQQLLREIGILGSVSHPNIVRLYELLETRDLFIMVQEDCRGGELLARLAAMPSFPEDNARHILRALLSAIVYLHERHIVHRDLKLENVLLADEPRGPDDWARQLRIADFGLANFADSDNRNLLKTRCGTFHYMPPEIIRGRTYGSAVDMWSVGVILFILLSGSYPFDADDAPTIMNNIKRGKWEFPEPEWVSPEALDLLGKLMVVDPEERLKPEEALKHPWFSMHDSPPGNPTTPVLPDQKKWLANIRKNHVVRNYIRKIVTKEASAAGSDTDKLSPPSPSPATVVANTSEPASTISNPSTAAVSTDSFTLRAATPVSPADAPETPSDDLSQRAAPAVRVRGASENPGTLPIQRRRSSAVERSLSLDIAPTSENLTPPRTPASALSPQTADTPTPHLADDKRWFLEGLPTLLADMSAAFQAQLAGNPAHEQHAALKLLRSTRGRSTDGHDYFRAYGLGASPVLPHVLEGEELGERYANEGGDKDPELERRVDEVAAGLAGVGMVQEPGEMAGGGP